MKTHTNMSVVRLMEGEERGACSAQLKELLKIVKDQTEERSVVVTVLSNESTISKGARIKTLALYDQVKYIYVGGMRVVINNRSVSEQINSDKVENVATGGSNIGEFRKVGKRQNLLGVVHEWSQILILNRIIP